MDRLAPGNVYRASEISGSDKAYRELRIFPTPFKGIYYVPYESERSGWYVTDPQAVAFAAARLYLGSGDYYFGLYSALYHSRMIWNPLGFDIINPGISRRISRKLPSGNYWRAKAIRKIMGDYPYPVRLHRMKNFSMKGVLKKGGIAFSGAEKTRDDAEYLCAKGDRTACEVLRIIEKQSRGNFGKKKQ